jgi:hypothetical protein
MRVSVGLRISLRVVTVQQDETLCNAHAAITGFELLQRAELSGAASMAAASTHSIIADESVT